MARRNRELRVKVAQDVLAQLRMKRYVAKQAVYVQVEGIDWDELEEDSDNASFQAFFKQKKEVTCNVCALGSCFVSLVNIKNKCSVYQMADEFQSNVLTFDRLMPVFGPVNLELMESAFECCPMDHCNSGVGDEMLEQAAQWGGRWDDPNERLRQIMINVIRNNGDFKLPKRMMEAAKREEAYWNA